MFHNLSGLSLLRTQLAPEDCFEIGSQVQQFGDQFSAILWLREALSRIENEETKKSLKEKILRKLTVALHKEGYARTSLALTNDLLQIRPKDMNATSNKIMLEHELKTKNATAFKISDGQPLHAIQFAKHRHHLHDYLGDDLREKYRSLCRGEVDRSAKRLATLKCRLVTKNSAFLRLAPLKLEEVHHNPEVVIFYDVMSDAEIKTVQKLAKPRFQRAVVFNKGSNVRVTANYRISKSSWLKDHEHKHIRDISLRVEDMTGLSVGTAEELQVVNYGVGGHYEPHYDFVRASENADWIATIGNRVSTVLFYMSDVAQGGATVFTKLNVGAWPKRGSAVFWHNLHASGARDFRTLHAGCPVLMGSKWGKGSCPLYT
jgi:prolyl 4-hydroxylase